MSVVWARLDVVGEGPLELQGSSSGTECEFILFQIDGATTTHSWTALMSVRLGSCFAGNGRFQAFAVKVKISATCIKENHCFGSRTNG